MAISLVYDISLNGVFIYALFFITYTGFYPKNRYVVSADIRNHIGSMIILFTVGLIQLVSWCIYNAVSPLVKFNLLYAISTLLSTLVLTNAVISIKSLNNSAFGFTLKTLFYLAAIGFIIVRATDTDLKSEKM
jgi:hypothetical protein